MPEISYTGPVLVEEGGVTRTLTADDIRGEQGPQGATGQDFAGTDAQEAIGRSSRGENGTVS